MKLGFEIFSSIKKYPYIFEVFPSASYKMLAAENIRYDLCLNDFVYGVKDMLDASVAALTVYEYCSGNGCEVCGVINHSGSP